MSRRAVPWVVVVVLALATGWLVARPYISSATFVLDLAGITGWWRSIIPVRVQAVSTRDLDVPTRYGPLAGRLYIPAQHSDRSLVVFPGIHAGGVDEPRFVAFSRRLAATGATVLSLPLPDLRAYRITPASTDLIEDATLWMASDHQLAPTGRVGLVGVSFAGGLALVAAGRPSLAGKVQLVVSLGGHANLPRVMTYLCTGRLPDGSVRPPHDYGVAIILLEALPRLVPPAQVEALHRAILTFLNASSYSSTDRALADRTFDEAKRAANDLPEPASSLMISVVNRDVGTLGPKLLPFIEELGGAAALSADRSPPTEAPVFLLHGATDNVIPSTETPLAAQYLIEHGNDRVRWLLTPVLTHATVQARVPAADAWKLIAFWKAMLAS